MKESIPQSSPNTGTNSGLSLAAEFPAVNEGQWRKLVEAALKGRSFERLVSRTGPWQVMTRIDHPDPAAANAQALHDLENGASGLALVFADSVGAYGYG